MTLRTMALVLFGPGLALLCLPAANAEPWIAVQQGMKCASCHVSPTGGGMRNEYGNLYAQMTLAAQQLNAGDEQWTGRVNKYLAAGGNLRSSATFIDVPNQERQQEFAMEESRLYLQFSPLPGRVDIYMDQRVAPGGSLTLEAWTRFWSADHDWYLRAGQMYLPFGLRLEDDSAFVRQVSGINFTTPDRGVEFGWESARWSVQAAVSNGTAGGAEIDTGKQVSLRAEHVRGSWRAGASVNVNDTDAGERNMQNVFAGLRTGPVAWLAEIDFITDDTLIVGREQQVALLEANWLVRRGHNLKLTAEYFDPDVDFDAAEQNRYSVVWEYFPFQFVQLRLGARMYDGDPLVDLQNREIVFLQLHGYY